MSGTKTIVKEASVLYDRMRPPPSGITILIYHRVGGGSTSDVDLDPAEFRAQAEHLAENHEVISLDEACGRLVPAARDWASPAPPVDEGRSSVVITVDDGTRDLTEHLLPTLADVGLPATVYLATRYIDEGVDFPWDAPPTSWAALADARDPLFTFGSHTHDHHLLDRAPAEEIGSDLDRSIDLIATHLGERPTHFAYPKALPGSAAAEIEVRRRFESAAVASSRVNRVGRTDLHRLGRTPVQRSDGFEHFRRKAAGGHRLEGRVRAAMAQVRYRGAER